jgi:anti-sigma regulatory factor (Ser/Thr protein kinase)
VSSERRIFSSPHAFCGRDRELERIVNAAFQGRSLAVTGPRGIGKSELLRQAFDELFYSENRLPIYFEFRSGEDALGSARRFASEMIAQVVAFRRRDADVIRAAPSLDEASRRALPGDVWVDSCIDAIRSSTEAEVIALSFSTPARLAAAGLDVCVLLDDTDLANDEIRGVIERQAGFGRMTLIIAGTNKDRLLRSRLATMALGPIDISAASEMAASLAAKLGIALNDATRDLIAVQLEGSPGDIRDLLLDAEGDDRDVSDFRSVQQLYVGSLITGRLSTGLRTDRVADDRNRLRLDLDRKGAVPAAVIGDAVVRMLQRAPELMAAHYRDRTALRVGALLESVAGRAVPTAAIGYRSFKEELKGLDDAAAIAALSAWPETSEFPRIGYIADAVDYYPPIAGIADRGRAAIGLTDAGEAWAIAEIDSKLEADAERAAFWCDRLEMAARSAGLDCSRLWLIAPEGFDEEALSVLAEREAYGSCRRQIELLRRLLDSPTPHRGNAYEITVPMGEEGELLANRTVDEIATQYAIPAKAAFQIKTALNEAMINAAEHSLSPDGLIRLSFAVDTTQLRLTIENRGLRLIDKMPTSPHDDRQRRGWGLDLMRRMMDEVRVETTDDGTRLVMSKTFADQPQ